MCCCTCMLYVECYDDDDDGDDDDNIDNMIASPSGPSFRKKQLWVVRDGTPSESCCYDTNTTNMLFDLL